VSFSTLSYHPSQVLLQHQALQTPHLLGLGLSLKEKHFCAESLVLRNKHFSHYQEVLKTGHPPPRLCHLLNGTHAFAFLLNLKEMLSQDSLQGMHLSIWWKRWNNHYCTNTNQLPNFWCLLVLELWPSKVLDFFPCPIKEFLVLVVISGASSDEESPDGPKDIDFDWPATRQGMLA